MLKYMAMVRASVRVAFAEYEPSLSSTSPRRDARVESAGASAIVVNVVLPEYAGVCSLCVYISAVAVFARVRITHTRLRLGCVQHTAARSGFDCLALDALGAPTHTTGCCMLLESKNSVEC